MITKERINGRLQRVKYKSLPNVLFQCGFFGHGSVACVKLKEPPLNNNNLSTKPIGAPMDIQQRVEDEIFGPWMLVEWHRQRKGSITGDMKNSDQGTHQVGSRFSALDKESDDITGAIPRKENYMDHDNLFAIDGVLNGGDHMPNLVTKGSQGAKSMELVRKEKE